MVVERGEVLDATPMVMRAYSGAGAKDFFDLREKRKSEVEAVMPGADKLYAGPQRRRRYRGDRLRG